MISETRFYGSAGHFTNVGGSDVIRAARVIVAVPTSSQNVVLPSALGKTLGGPYFTIFNDGSANVVLKDNFGNTVATIGSGVNALVFLYGNTTEEGSWIVCTFSDGVKDAGTASGRSDITAPAGGVSPVSCVYPDFQLRSCDGTTVLYTNTDLQTYIDDKKVVKVSGECYIPEIAEPILTSVSAITVTASYDNTDGNGCRRCENVWKLTDCAASPASPKYTSVDLSSYDGQTITISGSTKCWSVSEVEFTGQTLESVTVKRVYDSCSCCLCNNGPTNVCCGVGACSVVWASMSVNAYDTDGFNDLCSACWQFSSASAFCRFAGTEVGDPNDLIFYGYTGISFAMVSTGGTGYTAHVWFQANFYCPSGGDEAEGYSAWELSTFPSQSATDPLAGVPGGSTCWTGWGFRFSGQSNFNCQGEKFAGCPTFDFTKSCDEVPSCFLSGTGEDWATARAPATYRVKMFLCDGYFEEDGI